MNGLAPFVARTPLDLDGFSLLCWSHNYQARNGMISLQEAVDRLQELAVSSGLVRAVGQDSVQRAMADAFSYNDPALVDYPTRLSPIEFGSAPKDVLFTEHAQGTNHYIKFTPFRDLTPLTNSRYLIKGLIPRAGLVVVWGAPKCGKSFLVFDMVANIAAGRDYRGQRVNESPVVYFALEGAEGFIARVEAFRKAHNIQDIPFYLSSDRILLPQDAPAVALSISNQFPGVKPGVVVLDTLNRSITGSENDPSDMGGYVRAADMIREEFDCVVIIVHHCGVEGGRPRGHTSLTGAADAQIAVKRDNSDNIVATVEFMKDGPAGLQIVSYLEQVTIGADDDGDAITSCVIRPSNAPAIKAQTKVKGQAALALRILCEAINDVGEIPPADSHIPQNTRTISEKEWRARFHAGMSPDESTPGSRQRAFVRASNILQKSNCIGKWGDHIWLV